MEKHYFNKEQQEIAEKQYYEERKTLYRDSPYLMPGTDTHYIVACEFLQHGRFFLIDRVFNGKEFKKYVKRTNPSFILARHSR